MNAPVTPAPEKKTKGKTSKLGNIVIASFASYAEFALYLLCGILVARGLGPQKYGVYAFSVWLCGWLILLSNNGLTISAIRFVAEARGRSDMPYALKLGRTMIRWQTYSSLTVCLLAAAFLLLLPPAEWADHVHLFVLVAVLSTWARSHLLLNVSIGKGFENYAMGNIGGLIGAAASLVLIVAWRYFDGDLLGYFSIYAFSGFIAYLVSRRALLKHIPAGTSSSMALEPDLLKQTSMTGLYFILLALSNKTFETALLKAYHPTEMVGYFAIAGTLSKGIIDILNSGYEKVLLPTMSKLFGEGGGDNLLREVSESVRIYWMFGMIASGLGLTCSDALIALLYGPAYVAAVMPTKVSLAVGGFCAFVGALNALQISTGNQLERIKICIWAASWNLAFAVLLVPKYGLPGGVAAMVVGVIANAYFSVRLVQTKFGFSLPFGPMGKIFLSHCVAVACTLPLNNLIESPYRVFLVGPAFGVLFVVASIIFRSWHRNEFEAVIRLISGTGKFGALAIPVIRFAQARCAIR